MEEFRRAHRRMFGDNDCLSQKSDNSSKSEPNSTQNETKESIKETKSLPITTTPVTTVKTPPAVPIKKTSTGPVVQIGTYCNNSFTNNRFVGQSHRSVIQVRRQDSSDSTGTNGDQSDSQITIKVISTKQ